MKKFLITMIAVCTILFAFGMVNALAATNGIYTYSVSNGEATITKCSTSANGDITIPATLGGYPVTTIGRSAFNNCYSLVNITISDGVTSIGDYAFSRCNIESITIPDSVTSIGKSAFSDCTKLISIEISDSITNIGDSAFANCESLVSITVDDNNQNYCSVGGVLFDKNKTILIQYPLDKSEVAYIIPDSVTSICDYAFSRCGSLESITIPDSVTSIGSYVFQSCSSLESITVDDNNQNYCSVNGVLFDKNKTILIKYPIGKSEVAYIIPDSVTSICDYAFFRCSSLESITIGDSVTSIGYDAFYYCSSLKNITISDSVTNIGGSAFYACENLTSINIPDSVTNIGSYAFNGCTNLTSITGGEGVTSISDKAFYNTAYYNNAENWEENVLYIGKLLIKAKTEIGGSYVIKDNTLTIADTAFDACDGLTNITIPNSVKSIGNSAFSFCYCLTSITIPDSVTSIGKGAFSYCSNLTSINVSENNQNYSSTDGVLFNKNKTVLIQYPNGKTDTKYSIPDGVTIIGERAFWLCQNLKSLTIPDSVTAIEKEAFSDCYNLTSLTLGNGVVSIGDSVFRSCSLRNVTIPDSVTSIGNGAFVSCYGLTSITIGKGVTTIGDYVFEMCVSLESITVSEENENYSTLDGVLFNKNKTTLLQYPSSRCNTEYSIPNTSVRCG